MTSLKKHIVYVLLASYVALTISGICLLFGVAKGVESTGSVIGIFATFITQTAAIIVAIVKSQEYFSDPEEIKKLEVDCEPTVTTSIKPERSREYDCLRCYEDSSR